MPTIEPKTHQLKKWNTNTFQKKNENKMYSQWNLLA
jgi:hypothetical protein